MKREIIEVPVISYAIPRLGAPTSAVVRAGGWLMTCGMPLCANDGETRTIIGTEGWAAVSFRVTF